MNDVPYESPGDHPVPSGSFRGRREEVATLRSAIERLSQGAGSSVVVRGAPGSGKSRLLVEATEIAQAHGVRPLVVRGRVDQEIVPLGPLLDALTGGTDPVMDTEDLRALSLTTDQRYWLLHELRDQLERATLHTPLLVIVDDLHWCDDLTLHAIRSLSERLAHQRVGWLVSVREESRSTVGGVVESMLAHGADTMVLHGLDPAATSQVVEDVLCVGEIDEAVLATAVSTDRQPVTLVELFRGLRDEGYIVVEGGVAHLTESRVPDRYRDLVTRRLGRLGKDSQRVGEAIAVMGGPFNPRDLVTLLALPAPALTAAVRELLDAGVLAEGPDGPAFSHELIRQAVLDSVPDTVRRLLARQAVDVLLAQGASVIDVAPLLVTSAQAGDREAIEVLRSAASMIAASTPAAAADLFLRAMSIAPQDTATYADLASEAIPALWRSGRGREANALGDIALLSHPTPDAQAAIRLGLAMVASHDSVEEAIRQCEVAMSLQGTSAATRCRGSALLALNWLVAGDLDKASGHAHAALELADQAGDPAVSASSLGVQAIVQFLRWHWDEASSLTERAAVASREVDPGALLWAPQLWEAHMLSAVGREADALAVADDGLAQAVDTGLAMSVSWWTMTRAQVLLQMGDVRGAQVEAEAAAAMIDDLGGGTWSRLTAEYTAARATYYTSDASNREAALATASGLRESPSPMHRLSGLWLDALEADHSGDRAALETSVMPLVRAVVEDGVVRQHMAPDPSDDLVLLRLCHGAGLAESSRQLLSVLESRSTANPDSVLLEGCAAHARGLLDEDATSLARAVELWRRGQRPLLLATALEDLAMSSSTSARAEVVALLDEARVVYEASAATRDAARVRGHLRRLGVRRRPGGSRSPGELTSAESAVANLVAQGATNREVASQLFLSPHTVDSHLRRVFAKLGVRSRVELARRLPRPDSSAAS